MPNSIQPRPLTYVLEDLKRIGLSDYSLRAMRDILTRVDKTVTDKGEVQAQVPLVGRSEGLGITVQKLNAAGQLDSLLNVVADRVTDNITDGTGSPLTGGKRGFVALDTNNRLAGTFRNNPVNVAATPTSTTGMTNDGISNSITVPAQTFQFGDNTVSYNAGSFNPGSFGSFYAWIDDPTFSGGAPSISFSTTPPNQTAANGRIPLGKITTVVGTAKTGGGYTGGTTVGGAGGRGYIQ